ncbi:MAG TPA: hypothetical protein VHU19_14300 [Pyrinomonadaceae bacterium]|jgi:hypothetical protein|nr:hypothetical protein [Pyrinomonadaceae bacterium]
MPGKTFDLSRQVTFALAATLTTVAKEAQAASIKEIERDFTVRNNWDQPGNAMGIKALPATKDDLSAAVATKADWLIPHEEGTDKTPLRIGGQLAIPTTAVRRTKRDIIRKNQRPRALSRAFLLKTKNGPVIAQWQGRGKNRKLVVLYHLKPRAKIRKQSTVVTPTVKVFEKRFDAIFFDQLKKAVATAR